MTSLEYKLKKTKMEYYDSLYNDKEQQDDAKKVQQKQWEFQFTCVFHGRNDPAVKSAFTSNPSITNIKLAGDDKLPFKLKLEPVPRQSEILDNPNSNVRLLSLFADTEIGAIDDKEAVRFIIDVKTSTHKQDKPVKFNRWPLRGVYMGNAKVDKKLCLIEDLYTVSNNNLKEQSTVEDDGVILFVDVHVRTFTQFETTAEQACPVSKVEVTEKPLPVSDFPEMFESVENSSLFAYIRVKSNDGIIISANPFVLKMHSPYFYHLMHHVNALTTEEDVEVDFMNGKSLKQLLEWMHTGQIECLTNVQSVFTLKEELSGLLEDAARLGLTQFPNSVDTYLRKLCKSRNLLYLADLAHQYNLQSAFKEIIKNIGIKYFWEDV